MNELLYETQRIISTNKEQKIQIKSITDIKELPQIEDIKDKPQENFIVICLNNKNIIQSIELVGIGTTNCIPMNQSDVIRGAILRGATSIIMIHNHPSGDSTPSKVDLYFTKKIKAIANYLNINVLDHIIVGEQFYSMAEHHQIEMDNYFYELESDVIQKLKDENNKLKEEIFRLKTDKESIKSKIEKAKTTAQSKNKKKNIEKDKEL